MTGRLVWRVSMALRLAAVMVAMPVLDDPGAGGDPPVIDGAMAGESAQEASSGRRTAFPTLFGFGALRSETAGEQVHAADGSGSGLGAGRDDRAYEEES